MHDFPDPKQPKRPHHVRDWAESKGLRPVDLANRLGADPGMISRWYTGTTPSSPWQDKLADFFGTTPEMLFRHPGEAWLAEFFAGRTLDEIERMKQMLEAGFPRTRDR